MVSPISEADARAALAAAHSAASDPQQYEARRLDGGWLFGWKTVEGPAPMGARTWIVTDAARVRRLGFSESGADGIRAASATGDPAR